ncbi:MAG: hypothetical protein KBD78_03435 [Oligoflexales bacterium]|nr:hypothetical protein [Oligoflexales bacterium]
MKIEIISASQKQRKLACSCMSQLKQINLHFLLYIVLIANFLAVTSTATAQSPQSGNYEYMNQETSKQVKTKIEKVLNQYCGDACQLLGVEVTLDEALPEDMDLGFESVKGSDGTSYFVDEIIATIQIDSRVTQTNRERLQNILTNHLSTLGHRVKLTWQSIELPQIGKSLSLESQIKNSLHSQIDSKINRIIDTYCPEKCILSRVGIDGNLVSPDQATQYSNTEIFRNNSPDDGLLKVENIDIEVSMDSSLEIEERNKISNIMKANLRWITPVRLDVVVSEFPESYNKKKLSEQDPYGLGKLRETLQIFRDLAGTKEIISRESSVSTSQSNSSLNSKELNSLSSSEKLASSSSLEAKNSDSQNTLLGSLGENTTVYALGALVVLLLGLFLISRFNSARKDAQMMVDYAHRPLQSGQAGNDSIYKNSNESNRQENNQNSGANVSEDELGKKIRIQKLREELSDFFLDNPKVAKETYGRILQDEGIEQTAKYVHIFGRGVIFELLGDPNFQRDLYELTEYYQKTHFDFTLDEEIELLSKLKTRVTANEIRVLTRKTMQVFDFVFNLDAGQLHNLIVDEKPQVQSIVLTQLDHKRRKAVFDMFEGSSKVQLLKELCRAEAFPKDYLSTVAQALAKKVTTRPEFDTHNLRTTDILYDLLEKADLTEQKALMRNLNSTNPEAARGIKLKLVTLEVIPYLRDGQVLELVLGLERTDLVTFLRGTKDHIRNLLFSKVPEELAESWREDLMNMSGIDDELYRMVELKILGKVRALASKGAISLMSINDMIFADSMVADGSEDYAPLQRERFVA